MPGFVTIADDFTGAADQAGMLARAGVRSVLVLDETFAPGDDWDAVTFASRLRSLPVQEARRCAQRLFSRADDLASLMVQYKFCSTFDSTPEGNIGPCLDVACEALSQVGGVVVPALPVNGRTTYMGNHFVLGVPLSESPMAAHPLNPMTDSNLVRWLGRQTPRRIGLVPYETVEQGPAAIRGMLEDLWGSDVAYIVIDCLSQGHVHHIARAVADLSFISGSSALAMELPGIWGEEGVLALQPGREREPAGGSAGERVAALSGSCAAQTLRQIEKARGYTMIRLDVRALLDHGAPRVVEDLAARMAASLEGGERPLVVAGRSTEEREQTRDEAQKAGLSPRDLGLQIEELMGRLARMAVEQMGVTRLLVAGGETSGAVCQALGLRALEIVAEIDPGVPLCRSLPDGNLTLALKGGNFGADDFFRAGSRL